MQFPPNSAVLNVKDFGAKGDGVTDDTATINRAIEARTPAANTGNYCGQAKIVYFPSGTYLILAPLIRNNGSGNPTCGIMLIGQSESTTTIKPEPNAPGFGDPSNPLGMIHPTADAPYGCSPEPGGGNDAYQNTIQDLSIDIGTGNPQMLWASILRRKRWSRTVECCPRRPAENALVEPLVKGHDL
ncbi:MAG TPA: glycosyl hydrolase family 28-related protein [Acidobacteriaceae bacterium]|nr:glycosyl hydrolase family 28-related protein [Acidobacteriaceae bacterium]